MTNIVRRIAELQKIVDKADGVMDASDCRKYRKEIAEMQQILSWVGYQCSHLAEGSYDNETRELKFVMKNTTRFHYKRLNFTLIAGDIGEEENIPVTLTDWKPGKTKEISIYHDFNKDWNYQTRKVIKLKNHANSVEYEIFDKRANKNTGLEKETRKLVTGYSKKQGYLVTIRSFCESVTEYDLRAKGRRLENTMIDIFDLMSAKPDLRAQTRKFMVVYLPTVNRILDDYQKAIEKNIEGSDLKEIQAKTHEALNLAITAFGELKTRMETGNKEAAEVDLDIMKKFMKEEGLI